MQTHMLYGTAEALKKAVCSIASMMQTQIEPSARTSPCAARYRMWILVVITFCPSTTVMLNLSVSGRAYTKTRFAVPLGDVFPPRETPRSAKTFLTALTALHELAVAGVMWMAPRMRVSHSPVAFLMRSTATAPAQTRHLLCVSGARIQQIRPQAHANPPALLMEQ